jgi:hypothetical protein
MEFSDRNVLWLSLRPAQLLAERIDFIPKLQNIKLLCRSVNGGGWRSSEAHYLFRERIVLTFNDVQQRHIRLLLWNDVR